MPNTMSTAGSASRPAGAASRPAANYWARRNAAELGRCHGQSVGLSDSCVLTYADADPDQPGRATETLRPSRFRARCIIPGYAAKVATTASLAREADGRWFKAATSPTDT